MILLSQSRLKVELASVPSCLCGEYSFQSKCCKPCDWMRRWSTLRVFFCPVLDALLLDFGGHRVVLDEPCNVSHEAPEFVKVFAEDEEPCLAHFPGRLVRLPF